MSRRRRGRPRGDDRISYADAATILGVTKTTVARWVAEGYLDAWRNPTTGYHRLWRTVVLELRDDRNNEARTTLKC